MTTRFFYIVCVIVSFLVLSLVQSQTFIEDQKLQKQISYSRYFAYPFEISHNKRTRFFKNFYLVFGCMVFTLFHKNNRTLTLTNFRKILKNLLPCMIFPGGKSPSFALSFAGEIPMCMRPFFNIECW